MALQQVQLVGAASQVPPPASFGAGVQDADLATAWPDWMKTFNRYAIVANLGLKAREEQVGMFLYSMGPVADKVLKVVPTVDEDTATLAEMKAAFTDYFRLKTNTLTERAKFNKLVQQPGQAVDSFIQELHRLADNCAYGGLKEELIRDRIIVGVLDSGLSDRLQTNPDLTLVDAIRMARLAETRAMDKVVIRGLASDIGQVSVGGANQRTANQLSPGQPKAANTCFFCGKAWHPRGECPAKRAVCSKCKKIGHFQVVCRSPSATSTAVNKVNELTDINELTIPTNTNRHFLGEVSDTSTSKCWHARINVGGHSTEFKLDTGAEVTVLSCDSPLLRENHLSPSTHSLRGPDGGDLPLAGSLECVLSVGETEYKEIVYVLSNRKSSLLGKKACEAPGLVSVSKLVYEVSEQRAGGDFREEFPTLFRGLGKFGTPYKIQLHADAKPLCLYTARTVPHPLMPKVEDELKSMEQLGVISPVTEPTDWCSGMVVVPKKNGSVRICVDLTQLNRSVRREVHPMASVDESLAKLGGSSVYSKLDANSGLWQLPLDEASQRLTTFITPFGRYCFNRLPFGITSALEVFQRAMPHILEGYAIWMTLSFTVGTLQNMTLEFAVYWRNSKKQA